MVTPVLRSPIVLVHGFLGFDRVQMGAWTFAHYFRSIPEMLRAAGNRVLLARLNPIGGIAERAAQLKTFLDAESPHEPVHLIGHSMGGLDCRHMISRLGMASRVLSLTTLGTPHRGTAFADWGVSRFTRLVCPAQIPRETPSRTIATPLDFIGLNYYFRQKIAADPTVATLGFRQGPVEGAPTTALDWEVHPAGLDMFLIPSARGRGLGPDAAHAMARHLVDERGRTRVTVDPYAWNEAAVRAWVRAGFVEVSRHEAGGEYTAPWILMEFRG